MLITAKPWKYNMKVYKARLLLTCLFLGCMLLPLRVTAQTAKAVQVKYVSKENIYLNAGSAAGLAVGDILSVRKNGKEIARLKIAFVARHSASCTIIRQTGLPAVGDKVVVIEKATPLKKETVIAEKKPETTGVKKKTKPIRRERASQPRISGYLSAQWYQFDDRGSSNLDYRQPTIRFNLRATRLFGDDYRLRIKWRSRYDQRRVSLSSAIPRNEWRNRLYEVSFRYANEKAPFNWAMGRIISNAFSGVGYIDGIMLQHNISSRWRWGLFGGLQPEWHYSTAPASIQKYGLFAAYKVGDYSSHRFESTLSMAGAYHGGTVSREFMYWQNNYSWGSSFTLFQSLELDLNRDWKQKTTGETVSLTGVYINGRYTFNRRYSVGLSYDNRKNYLTWYSRTLADSLFNDAFRQGVRLTLNARLFRNFRLFANGGLRHRQDAVDITWSYMGGLNWNRMLGTPLMLMLRYAGFNNFYTIGINPNVSLSYRFRGGHLARLSYGYYGYALKADNSENHRNWIRLNSQFELPLDMFMSGEYQYDWGDDLNGQRFFIELGYRF